MKLEVAESDYFIPDIQLLGREAWHDRVNSRPGTVERDLPLRYCVRTGSRAPLIILQV